MPAKKVSKALKPYSASINIKIGDWFVNGWRR